MPDPPLQAAPPATYPEPRLDRVPSLAVAVGRRDGLAVLEVPRYRRWGARLARRLRLPTERRIVLDAEGSRVVALIDGDRTLGAIAREVAGEDREERARLFTFVAELAVRGWLVLAAPRDAEETRP